MTDFTFQTVGGLQRAELLEGADGDSPIVVVAPAIGIDASYYQGFCTRLVERGLGAVAIDMPGHGVSPIRASRHHDWGYEELVDHYRAALRALARSVPGAPIYLLGHSLGGHIALMLSGTCPQLKGVFLVASGVPYWRFWSGPGALVLRGASAMYGVIARILGVFPGRRLGFGTLEARTLIVQWAETARTGTFDIRGFKGEPLLGQPGPPVRSIGLRGDTFAPEASIRHLLDKLGQRDVSHELWESPPHGGDHNRWPTDPGFVVDWISGLTDT